MIRPAFRQPLAGALALGALLLAAAPWLGAIAWPIDLLTPAWPLAPVLAAGVLMLTRPWTPAAIAGIVALALVGAMLVETDRSTAADDPTRRLVIVTHNVAVFNVDPAATAAALIASDADILLLQETNGAFAPMVQRLRARFPYGSACERRCSLAIFSRYPLERVRYRFRTDAGRPIGPGLVQTVVYLPGERHVPIATLHLPRGERYDTAAERRAALAAAVETVPGRAAMILAGDFNLVPWSARLRTLDRLLRPLTRVTRAAFSYPARVGGVAALPIVPIDHLYAGAAWRVASVTRMARTGSDHFPLRIVLIWHGDDRYGNESPRTAVGRRPGVGD